LIQTKELINISNITLKMQQEIDFSKDLQEKQPHNTFKFKCVKGCKLCCSMNDIALYPFDIMALCDFLNIESNEFHQKYSRFWFDSEAKILRCYLKTSPDCVFFDNKDACIVYDARPTRCRTFPVGRMFNKDNTVQHYLPTDKCIGFDSKQKHTIQEWMDNCGVSDREDLIKEWNTYIIKLKNRTDLPLADKFFMMFFQKIFYDFDNDLPEVAEETKEMVKNLDKSDHKARMKLLYKLSEIYLDNIEDWKKFYEKADSLTRDNEKTL